MYWKPSVGFEQIFDILFHNLSFLLMPSQDKANI